MRPISKIALYCGLVLLLIGVILFWLGSQKKNYQVDTLIDAPADAVFPHLTDPKLIPNWMHSVVLIEPLTPDGHQQGAQTKIVYEYEGKRIEFRDEVIVTDQDSRLLVSADCPMFRNSSDYSLYPLDMAPEKTNLRLRFQVQYKGFYRFMAPFSGSGSSVQAKLEEDMQRLKLEVERVHREASLRNGTIKKASTQDLGAQKDLGAEKVDTNNNGANASAAKQDKGDDGALIKKSNKQPSSKKTEQKK